jgi:hypothetical protein
VHDAPTVALFVVLLVMGILAVNAMVWIPIIIWWRRKSRAIQAQLAATIESEGAIRPPEKANYRGASAPGFPIVNNSGVIALTRRRLILLTLTGKSIEVPLTAITRRPAPAAGYILDANSGSSGHRSRTAKAETVSGLLWPGLGPAPATTSSVRLVIGH